MHKHSTILSSAMMANHFSWYWFHGRVEWSGAELKKKNSFSTAKSMIPCFDGRSIFRGINIEMGWDAMDSTVLVAIFNGVKCPVQKWTEMNMG